VSPKLTAVERGRRLAESNGCFGCHGPEGMRGTANAGDKDPTVPSFGSLMMYADNPQEVRSWIANGSRRPRPKRTGPPRRGPGHGTLHMPAFGDRLSKQEIDDLVAFVRAVASDPSPDDSLALAGRDRAGELGCVGCHGEGGRYARHNPGSLKGYVPPWDGADFPDLVKNEAEFRQWVEDGVSKRFENNRLARFFLDRAPLKMPAYEGKLDSTDVEALWAYVTWLRRS
jgi:mono/diheme cytochrome c family protein